MIGLKRNVAIDVLGNKRQQSKSIMGNKISHYGTHHRHQNHLSGVHPDNSDGIENGNTHSQQHEPKKISSLLKVKK